MPNGIKLLLAIGFVVLVGIGVSDYVNLPLAIAAGITAAYLSARALTPI